MNNLRIFLLSTMAIVFAMGIGYNAPAQDANGGPVVGTGDGLVESYYANRHLYGVATTNRTESTVDFDTNGFAAQGITRTNQFGMIWSGELQAQYSETYSLHLETDGGGRVWVNEQLLLDDWMCHTDREASASINLTAGQHYLIRVEYFENYGSALARLSWSSASTPKELIPQSQLYSHPTDTDGNGLPDLWQLHYFGHLGNDPQADPDNDGLSNLQEYQQHTDPTNPQSHGVPDSFWQGDIGGFSTFGGAASSNGVFTVSSAGGDMWGNSDSFHYLYQPLGTNGQVICRVLGLQANSEFAKAGIMIREKLDGRSRDAAMVFTRTNVATFQWRELLEKVSHAPNSATVSNACWFKLVRSGDWVGGYDSPDGTNWTLVDWMAFKKLAAKVYVGMAVSAHDGGSGVAATAQFDQFSVGPATTNDTMTVQEGSGDGLAADYRNDSLLYLSPGTTNLVDSEESFYWGHDQPFAFLNPDSYGVSWSGEMQAQFTGLHTIYLDTLQEDWVRVWVNEQLVIDGWRKWHPDGKLTTTINLVQGQHYLVRVEMYNNQGKGRAELRWSNVSMSERTIPRSQFYSHPTDTDGNGLPDLWQLHYFGHLGNDPQADPDNDGLSNLQEYQNHTDPTKADTDGDGLPDGWEIAHGLDPQYPGDASQDYNNSGYSNLQDYQFGLDPLNVDVNQDGLPDSFEVGYLGATGPAFSITNAVTAAASVDGAQAVNYLGNWQVDGSDIFALDRRGGLDFNFSVGSADKYVLNLIGTQNQSNNFQTSFKLLLGIDGQTLGHHTLNGGYGTNGTIELVLPWLAAGSHTIHVFWDGAASYSSLRIKQLKLLAVSGADANGDGVKDWAEQMMNDESGLDFTNGVISSYTSPICLEGRDPYPALTAMAYGQTNALAATATTDDRWYVNVPLQTSGQTPFQAAFQNGGLNRARQLQWVPLNALAVTNQLTIRSGDSLLFNAGGSDGTLQISYSTNSASGSATNGVSCAFPVPGVFNVSATFTTAAGAAQSASFTVDVVQQTLASVEPAAWSWMQRYFNIASLAPEAVLQADSRLTCNLVSTNANGSAQLALYQDANEPRTLLARLGTNGPVLSSTRVEGFDVWSGGQTYTKLIQQYPDGSQLIEMLMVSSPVNPNVTFQIQPIVSGVIFDDGTTLRTVTSTNFDALGQYPVRFLRPASAKTSVCNSIEADQGSYRLGVRE
jgi:hypothetical protein